MIFRKLLLVFGMICFLSLNVQVKAQNNCIAIAINEYCASNIPNNGLTDAFGELSDWVELKCNFSNSVSLSGYYLSNDRNNLFKWAFPNDFIMGSGGIKMVWLSGRNTSVVTPGGKEYHANFTLDQCKGQWLILATSTGVVRDSVFVRPAMGGHSWGRIDCFNTGAAAFKLFQDNAKSPGGANGSIYYDGYAPTPRLVNSPTVSATGSSKGGFYPDPQIVYFKMEGVAFDTLSSCYDIFYTEDGSYPVPGYPPVAPTMFYADSANSYWTISKTEVVRYIAVPSATGACSGFSKILPSYCETDSYFIDANHQLFTPEFGVMSVTMDNNWMASGGTSPTSVHVEYYDTKKQVVEGYAQIDRPINEAWVTAQKGFNISIDDRYGFGCNFEGPIFNVDGLGTTTRTVFPTLHLKGGDFESHSALVAAATLTSFGTGIRDVFMQSLAAKNNLHVNPLHVKPVVGFINGEYSGVYDLREVFDKYYEKFYHGQSMDSLDMNVVYNQQESNVRYWDNTSSTTIYNNWKTEVYDVVMNNPMNGLNNTKYKAVMDKLDKASFIDYMVLNSYAQNEDLFKFNVGFARGHDKSKEGYKWHYYLWNMPAIYNFTAYTNPGTSVMTTPGSAPCYIHSSIGNALPKAYDGHSNMLTLLMGRAPSRTTWGNDQFKLEYMNRYQDLVNGPLSCENLMKHYEYVVNLYHKEMKCHEDPSCESTGGFHTQVDVWDTNTTILRHNLELRCNSIANQFSKGNCYGLQGPFEITVDVRPSGAGKVKLNSILIDNYVWKGKYFQTTMSFKAIPTNTNYAFHHWEIVGPNSKDPISLDSIAINFNIAGEVIAVFTDKQNDINANGEGANIPTGFTPNGDGNNDIFRPLGSGEFASEYQMTIWNRWGQEVYRSTDPLVGWDGSFKGSQALTGVYAYVITYKNVFGESKLVKGNVTLSR
jgi:gliding motility-associated-like protein